MRRHNRRARAARPQFYNGSRIVFPLRQYGHQNLSFDFSHPLWQQVNEHACENLRQHYKTREIDILIASGTELLGYKLGNPQRLYPVCGIDPTILNQYNLKPHDIAQHYQQQLLSLLKTEYPELLTHVAMVKTATQTTSLRTAGYTFKPTDKLIYTLCNATANGNILLHYAHYLISLISALARNGNLPEIKCFNKRKISRNRLFQLYFMVTALFKEHLSQDTDDATTLRQQILPLLRCDSTFETFHRVNSTPIEQEQRLFNLIANRVLALKTVLADNTKYTVDSVTVSCQPFYGGDDDAANTITLSRSDYEAATANVTDSYRNIYPTHLFQTVDTRDNNQEVNNELTSYQYKYAQSSL